MSSIASQVDTVYAPGAGMPLGKVTQTSRPHAYGAPVYWTMRAALRYR